MSDDHKRTSRHVDRAVNENHIENHVDNDIEEGVDNHPVAPGDGREHREEIGGRAGPDPTRYGDWEKAGRCIDF